MCTTSKKQYAYMLDVPAKPARPYTDSPLPQTEEQRIEQDNREGKPDIVDIDLNKGTETGTRNQTRDGIQNGTDDRPTIRRKSHS